MTLPDTFLLSYCDADGQWHTTPIGRFENNTIALHGLRVETSLHRIANDSSTYRLCLVLIAEAEITLSRLSLFIHYNYSPQDKLLCNGYQSWTETREFLPHDRLPHIVPLAQSLVGMFGDYHIRKTLSADKHGSPSIPPLYGWTYGYIRPQNGKDIYFIGSLAEQSGYTAIGFDVRQNRILILKDADKRQLLPNETFTAFDLLIGEGNEAALFGHYKTQLNRPLDALKNEVLTEADVDDIPTSGQGVADLCAGWTSWYNYYTSVSEDIVLRDMTALTQQRAPLSWIQIDDGWQANIGDWLVPNQKFERGMPYLVEQIEQAGYRAGLWLAPFICTSQSALFQQHPTWLLRDEQGKPITAGYNPLWKSWLYVLDWQREEVQQYLAEVFETVCRRWGFKLLKLDFLYAAALYAPPRQTRGEAMHLAATLLRQWAGNDVVLLGCGIPLAPAFGVFDYCRIGADVHTAWEMPWLKWLNSRERVSTVLTLHNTINRRHLNGLVFGNDPDVSILRTTNHQLKQAERYTLFLMNQIFGAVQFISDNIADYDAETLHLYLSQFPLRHKHIERVKTHDQTYEIHFSIGNLRYLAFANLGEKPFEARLHTQQALLYFDVKRHIFTEQTWFCLQAHESACMLCTATDIPYQIVGSTGHLFAGSEVSIISVAKEGDIQLRLSEQLRHATKIFITVPKHLDQVRINGQTVAAKIMGAHGRIAVFAVD